MQIDKLLFFDKIGKPYNFRYDENEGIYKGIIVFKKVSVELYGTETIRITELIDGIPVYPMSESGNQEFLALYWDPVNKYVDEFGILEYPRDEFITETSALKFTPQDGPDVTDIIRSPKIEKYIKLAETSEESDDELTDADIRTLDIDICFSADERYLSKTFMRTLYIDIIDIKGKRKHLAEITMYAEAVYEDERLAVLCKNFGYDVKTSDSQIFAESNIHEPIYDRILINRKRKEMLLEGPDIYRRTGSYSSLIKAIKFYGYDMRIYEYWYDLHTGKKLQVKYPGSIQLPSLDYKKSSYISLAYDITKALNDIGPDGNPEIKEVFKYSIEDANIKLGLLKDKLNNEFMPVSSRIYDITGETIYFTTATLNNVIQKSRFDDILAGDGFAYTNVLTNDVFITSDLLFNKYLESLPKKEKTVEKEYKNGNVLNSPGATHPYEKIRDDDYNIIGIRWDTDVDDIDFSSIEVKRGDGGEFTGDYEITDKGINEYTGNPYVTIEYHNCDNWNFNDDYDTEWPHYIVLGYKEQIPMTPAEMVDAFISFDKNHDYIDNESFEDSESSEVIEMSGKCICEFIPSGSIAIGDKNVPISAYSDDLTIGDLDTGEKYRRIVWKAVHEEQNYEEITIEGTYDEVCKVLFRFKYTGNYTVTCCYYDACNNMGMTKPVIIYVRPLQIELNGFYYDARENPNAGMYSDEQKKTVVEFISKLKEYIMSHDVEESDMDMYYPYFYDNLGTLLFSTTDNISYDVSTHCEDSESSETVYDIFDRLRYVWNGVTVRPYTWIVMSCNITRIAGIKDIKWSVTKDGELVYTSGRDYLYFLYKDAGNYTVGITITDRNDNTYNSIESLIKVRNDEDQETVKNNLMLKKLEITGKMLFII